MAKRVITNEAYEHAKKIIELYEEQLQEQKEKEDKEYYEFEKRQQEKLERQFEINTRDSYQH
jgi:type III secretory pathway component EscR